MKIFTLGCSITDQEGIKERIAERTGLPIVNLSQSAGSNILQVLRLQQYIIDQEVKPDDIVLWQITSFVRGSVRKIATEELLDEANSFKTEYDHFVNDTVNYFDNKKRIDFLCHSPFNDDYFDINDPSWDPWQDLETLLAAIIFVSKITNVIVYMGWDEIMPWDLSRHNEKDNFILRLKNHNINFIDTPVLEWCAENGGLADDMHPNLEAYQNYADQIILPELKRL